MIFLPFRMRVVLFPACKYALHFLHMRNFKARGMGVFVRCPILRASVIYRFAYAGRIAACSNRVLMRTSAFDCFDSRGCIVILFLIVILWLRYAANKRNLFVAFADPFPASI